MCNYMHLYIYIPLSLYIYIYIINYIYMYLHIISVFLSMIFRIVRTKVWCPISKDSESTKDFLQGCWAHNFGRTMKPKDWLGRSTICG